MTVKAYIASAAYDPTVLPRNPLPAEETQGRVHHLVSTIEVANGDSITSTIKFGSIPSNARISRGSALDYDALTSLTDFSLGVGKTSGAVMTVQSAACLIANADIHTAGSKAFTAIDIANLAKPLWQIAGYSDDPGGDLDIIGVLNAASGAAGTITCTVSFLTP